MNRPEPQAVPTQTGYKNRATHARREYSSWPVDSIAPLDSGSESYVFTAAGQYLLRLKPITRTTHSRTFYTTGVAALIAWNIPDSSLAKATNKCLFLYLLR